MSSNRGRYNFDPGPVYGEISISNNDSVIELSVGAFVQITDFDTNGWSRKMTPDYSQNHITVLVTGIYKVGFCIHVENDASQSHTIGVSLFAKNGTEEFTNVHAHVKLTGGTGDVESVSGCGLVELMAGETIELWAISDSTPSLGVVFDDITLYLQKAS